MSVFAGTCKRKTVHFMIMLSLTVWVVPFFLKA